MSEFQDFERSLEPTGVVSQGTFRGNIFSLFSMDQEASWAVSVLTECWISGQLSTSCLLVQSAGIRDTNRASEWDLQKYSISGTALARSQSD